MSMDHETIQETIKRELPKVKEGARLCVAGLLEESEKTDVFISFVAEKIAWYQIVQPRYFSTNAEALKKLAKISRELKEAIAIVTTPIGGGGRSVESEAAFILRAHALRRPPAWLEDTVKALRELDSVIDNGVFGPDSLAQTCGGVFETNRERVAGKEGKAKKGDPLKSGRTHNRDKEALVWDLISKYHTFYGLWPSGDMVNCSAYHALRRLANFAEGWCPNSPEPEIVKLKKGEKPAVPYFSGFDKVYQRVLAQLKGVYHVGTPKPRNPEKNRHS